MKLKCVTCGKEKIHPHFLIGKTYGYNCYKLALALYFKEWEEEKNIEYSKKCFSAIEIFKNKKSGSFYDSIINQWNECKKITMKQLECIIRSFNDAEAIEFYKIWFC